MRFLEALSTLALMAAVVDATPLVARDNSGTKTKSPKVKSKTTSTGVPVSTGSASTPYSKSNATGGSSSGLITDACNLGYATQNGGTTGGGSAATTTVTTVAELTACAQQAAPAVCLITGALTGNTVIKVSADTTIAGAAGSSLTGIGLRVMVKNVILRNLKISKVLASAGDAIGIQAASNVWVDHCDLSSDRDHDKDYYDGLLDVTHASDYITISNTHLHDHWKASLVGHSDSNGAEDKGHLIVTYANNFFENINSRGPSIRFGTVHIYNHYSKTSSTGVNTRMGAEVLVESAVFEGIARAIESADSSTVGFATVHDVDLGQGTNTVGPSSLTKAPYEYALLGSKNVVSSVTTSAGQTLKF
ncbi:unnamed protein product [Diplocarpon coronariae]|nr:pectate lyase [Diplocarpon mali]